ncbi:MAG: HlyD family secretion protein [Planctomycetaceae bacterium]
MPFLRVLAAGLLVMLFCAATLPTSSPKVQETSGRFLTVPATQGTLRNVLVEQGLVDSARNIVVTSECEWPQRIIRLVPEGEWVQEGDVVVELDSSELDQRLRQREILIINAAASLVDAQEVFRLQKLENESAVAKAELAGMLAELDYDKYLRGEFPKLQKEAETAVALAAEDVTRAKERYQYTARMARKGYESYLNLEQERVSQMKYEHTLDTATRELDLLTRYTYARQIAELESSAARSKQELARVRQQCELALANREMLVQNREQQYQQHVDYAERLKRNIAACTIRAPTTGEIIYANEGSIRNEIVEGQTVRHRQEVVRIPDLDKLEIKVRVHESEMAGVREGLPATISIDAFPGAVYRGEVVSVSRVPTAGSYYTRDLKEYDAAVRIVAAPEETAALKPGLTAKVDIQIGHRENCLSVPPQSIVNIAGRSMIFVNTAQGVEHREIEIGLTTDTGVEVISGLHSSEQVLLSPRATCGRRIIALTESFGSETRVENIGG